MTIFEISSLLRLIMSVTFLVGGLIFIGIFISAKLYDLAVKRGDEPLKHKSKIGFCISWVLLGLWMLFLSYYIFYI